MGNLAVARRKPIRDVPAAGISSPDYVSQYVQVPLQWHYTPGAAADESDTKAAFPGLLEVADVQGSDGSKLPPPGMVGEGLYAARTNTQALNLNNGSPTNIVTLSVPPGDWDVWAVIVLELRQLNPVYNHWMACLTPIGESLYYPDQTTMAASGGPGSLPLTSFPSAYALAPVIATTTVTLTYYLNAMAAFTAGQVWAFGNIYARRRR